MQKKAINHVIQAKIARYIHTPKPQIQSVKPRKGKLGAKAIPCVLGEEGRIKRP